MDKILSQSFCPLQQQSASAEKISESINVFCQMFVFIVAAGVYQPGHFCKRPRIWRNRL